MDQMAMDLMAMYLIGFGAGFTVGVLFVRVTEVRELQEAATERLLSATETHQEAA